MPQPKKKKSVIDEFLALPDAEKDRISERVARSGVSLKTTVPLSATEQKLWDRAKKKLRAGRPRVGAGAKRVAITIERGLLDRADRYARAHHLKRTEIIAQGLELLMSA